MKTKFTVKIDLSAAHIRLMQDLNAASMRHNYTREVEYLESKGIVFAKLSKYPDNDIYHVSLTKLGQDILAEVESSEWKMQPGFVVTEEHINILKHMIINEYMNPMMAQILDFSEDVMKVMTGEDAPFPFFCQPGVAGGWSFIKRSDDTYPDYLEEAKNQVRKWEREHRPSVVLEVSADEGASIIMSAGEDVD